MKHYIIAAALTITGLMGVSHGQNLVLNPGFELGTSVTDITNWSDPINAIGQQAGRYGSPTHKSSFAESGFKFAGVNGIGSLVYLDQALTLQIGNVYTFSLYVYNGSSSQVEFYANIGGTLGSTAVGTTLDGNSNYVTGGQVLFDLVGDQGSPAIDLLPYETQFNSTATTPLLYTTTFVATAATSNLILGGRSENVSLYLDDVSVTPAAAPEPSTYAMMALGLASLGFLARRKLA